MKRHVGLARYKLQVDMSDKLYNIIVNKYDGFEEKTITRLNEMNDFEIYRVYSGLLLSHSEEWRA